MTELLNNIIVMIKKKIYNLRNQLYKKMRFKWKKKKRVKILFIYLFMRDMDN